MNPLTNMKNVKKLSEQELYAGHKTSWHDQYRRSAWIFVGGLSYDLTEGDIICIFSQHGEIVNINLVRDKDSGKSKGFCFICYEDQRSTDLAVDNFNGIKILNRIIRVDHVENYKVPKDGKKTDEETKKLYEEGCAPKVQPIVKKVPENERIRETLADQIQPELKLPPRLPIFAIKQEKLDDEVKVKKERKEKGKKKKSKKPSSSSDSSTEDERHQTLKSKKKTSKKFAKQKEQNREAGKFKEQYRDMENYEKTSKDAKYKKYDERPQESNKYKRSRSRSPFVDRSRGDGSRSWERRKDKSRCESPSSYPEKQKSKHQRSRSADRNRKYDRH